MYDPTVGQFLSEDPIDFDGLDENLRRYVKNQVLNKTDPSGLLPVKVVKGIPIEELLTPVPKAPPHARNREEIPQRFSQIPLPSIRRDDDSETENWNWNVDWLRLLNDGLRNLSPPPTDPPNATAPLMPYYSPNVERITEPSIPFIPRGTAPEVRDPAPVAPPPLATAPPKGPSLGTLSDEMPIYGIIICLAPSWIDQLQPAVDWIETWIWPRPERQIIPYMPGTRPDYRYRDTVIGGGLDIKPDSLIDRLVPPRAHDDKVPPAMHPPRLRIH